MSVERPKIGEASKAFMEVYDQIGGTVEAVGRKIGGKVDYNINHLPSENRRFKNACAIRLSYVLNKTGIRIPKMAGKVVSGKEGHWYIYRVKVMKDYLTKIFGKPDFTYAAPTMEKLLTHKGIIIFEVEGWGDASGHATIWDGLRCSDKCYFDKAKKVHLWSLEN